MWRILVVLVLAAPSAVAHAAALAELEADVDGDGADDAVSVQDDGRLVVLSGGKSVETRLGDDAWRVTRAAVELKAYPQHRVLLVRSGDVDGVEQAGLYELRGGTLEQLWMGDTGAQGRDGEWRIHVELGEKLPLTWNSRQGVERCDGARVQLHLRGFDFGSGKWKSLRPSGPLKVPQGAVMLKAARGGAPAGLDATTTPSVFHATAASSSEEDGGSAQDLATPREIEDGKLGTAWAEGRGGFGRGEFVTLRSKAKQFRVVALRLWPGDAGSAAKFGEANRLRRVHVITDTGVTYVVDLDPDPVGAGFAEPYWVVLPKPLEARCLSVVIDEVWPGKGAKKDDRTAISELAVLTDLDAGGPGALAELAEKVAAGGADADGAEDMLAARGTPGAQAMVAALATGGRTLAEQRRLRLALARMGDPVGAGEVILGLVQAADEDTGGDGVAEDKQEKDFQRYRAGLERMGVGAGAALQALLGDEAAPENARVAAAGLLGPLPGGDARAALEARCGTGSRALRSAVTLALGRRAPDELPVALDAAIAAAATNEEDGAALAREADLWRVVALLAARDGGADARARGAEAAVARLAGARGYELRHRLVQALTALWDQPAARTALAGVLASDGEPAIRIAVITGLGLGALAGDAEAGALLAGALADGDPGVRAGAAAALGARGDEPATDAALAGLLVHDRWPTVRVAAAEALAPRCKRAAPADALFAAVQDDGDGRVRRAAVVALVQCRDQRVGPLLIEIVGNDRLRGEWRRFAAGQLGGLGDTALVPRMVELFERLRRESFGDDEAPWIAATLAQSLGVLGDARAENALIEAAEDPTFPPIQVGAIGALAETCPARAQRTFKRALDAEDGTVVRAARLAVKRCPKP